MAESNIEEFKYGKFSLTPKEKAEAEKEGNLKEKEEEMKKATKALRAGRTKEAIEEFEKQARKE